MKKLLGKVDLRNSYAVYEEDGAYIVASENPRGQRYECRVVPEAVSYLCRRLQGQRVTAEQAGKAVEPVAERFELPYTYELMDRIVQPALRADGRDIGCAQWDFPRTRSRRLSGGLVVI